MVHPGRLRVPNGFKKDIGKLLAFMKGHPVEALANLWNVEVAKAIDTITHKYLLSLALCLTWELGMLK